VTGSLFAFAPYIATNQIEDLIFSGPGLFYVAKIVEILLLTAHIYSDVSLGPSGANITLKKLQTRGPYGLIRHPGTTTKLLLWLIQAIIYKKFWTAKIIIGYIGWGTVYVLRAFTEERHLKKFAKYREYCKKVKHRFFPGLF
jgi:protein-S-isoprenylcysteine O-methyltransferase Ste14